MVFDTMVCLEGLFCLLLEKNGYICSPESGALDEWLSQRSAKPFTAVRIRQAPQNRMATDGRHSILRCGLRVSRYAVLILYSTSYIENTPQLVSSNPHPVPLYATHYTLKTNLVPLGNQSSAEALRPFVHLCLSLNPKAILRQLAHTS